MENNLTQKEFAKMLNVHQTAVSQWETDKTIPDVGIIKTMTELFGVSADYILGKKTVLTQQNANFFIFFSTFFQEMFKRSKEDFERALKENEAVFKTSMLEGTTPPSDKSDTSPTGAALGKWLINPDGYYPYCSECGAEPEGRKMTKFCSECGADMRSTKRRKAESDVTLQ